MGIYRSKRTHKGRKHIQKKHRLRRRTKDLDQISEQIQTGKSVTPDYGEDLPGNGEFYCTSCDRHFIDQHALTEHDRSKTHKRQLKILTREKPYTLEESRAAGGSNSNAFYSQKVAAK